jgi:hypothetical protein
MRLGPTAEHQDLPVDLFDVGTVYWLIEATRQGRVIATGEIKVLALPPVDPAQNRDRR